MVRVKASSDVLLTHPSTLTSPTSWLHSNVALLLTLSCSVRTRDIIPAGFVTLMYMYVFPGAFAETTDSVVFLERTVS